MTGDTMMITPAPEESVIATAALSKLEKAVHENRSVQLHFSDGFEDVIVPQSAMLALRQALSRIAKGASFSILSVDTELTTQMAADQLGVSRPYLIKLLDEGLIEYRKVGAHRRVKAASLMRYKQTDDITRQAAADALACEVYELGLT